MGFDLRVDTKAKITFQCTKVINMKFHILERYLDMLRHLFHQYMHTYIHTYIHTYMHTYIHTYIQTSSPNLRLCTGADFGRTYLLLLYLVPRLGRETV